MAEIFQLKHSGEQIDELLDKAETAVQPILDGDGNTYLMADGLVTSEDTHYYFPDNAPANDPAHTFAMASAVQATDAKLTELSWEKGTIGSNGELDSEIFFRSAYIPCKVGDVISAYIFRVRKYDANLNYIGEALSSSNGYDLVDYTMEDASCSFVRIVIRKDPNVGTSLLFNGTSQTYTLNKRIVELISGESSSLALSNNGIWLANYANTDVQYRHFAPIPCKKGDVIRGDFYSLVFLDEYQNYINTEHNISEFEITDSSVRYVVINCLQSKIDIQKITINDSSIISYALEGVVMKGYQLPSLYPFADTSTYTRDHNNLGLSIRLRGVINNAIKGLWIKNPKEGATYHLRLVRYRQQGSDWNNTEYTQIGLAEKLSDGTINYINLVNDLTSANINDEIQIFETTDFLLIIDWRLCSKGSGASTAPNSFNIVDNIVFGKNNTIYLATMGQGTSGGNGSTEGANLSANPYIAMPIPQLAMVNIVAGRMPTTKTDDILATLEFNDMQGNVFAKKIIMNAQGTSSLGLAKKNLSIDIMDEDLADSHEIKFGDWVAQDGFHLKAYMLDGVRVKPMAAYDFYESMLLTRGVRKDRAWKRLQLPTEIPITSNSITDSYLQLDDGAKNHPSGFPIILYFNGVFYGIYCWQLKKHRANYHQKKSKAEHIHLDGNISNILLWEANGVINWNKWAGKEMESDSIQNKDGIEVRNPKKLILTDGTEYDADTNAGELISEDSVGFDAANDDMVRTASVRANIESLSRRVYALTQMANGAEKKSAIAEVFDVDSIIDYIIFSQIMCNQDGYKKNWQWVTYNGIKWAVNAYDLDGTWGWGSWNYLNPVSGWIHNDTPPITLIIENYLDEIKARYKELRDKGVIDLAKIMQPLVNYVKVIGIDYYDMEYEKWTDGSRDNLWRFESWMEESIRRTDILMDYNKAA